MNAADVGLAQSTPTTLPQASLHGVVLSLSTPSHYVVYCVADKPVLGLLDRPAKVSSVREFLIAGGTRREVAAFAREQGWADSAADIREFIREAREEIASWVEQDRKAEFSMAAERLNALYRACMYDDQGNPLPANKRDKKTAFMVQRELAELFGLHAPKRVDVDSTVRALSKEQLRAELLEMATKIEAIDAPDAAVALRGADLREGLLEMLTETEEEPESEDAA